MIGGIVDDRNEAIIHLEFRGFNGAHVGIDAIVDTGYSGFLTLPISIVTQLGLVQCGDSSIPLADGSEHPFAIYSVDVEWDGAFRNVFVSVVGEECLVGMKLFRGYELNLEVRPGGSVKITKL